MLTIFTSENSYLPFLGVGTIETNALSNLGVWLLISNFGAELLIYNSSIFISSCLFFYKLPSTSPFLIEDIYLYLPSLYYLCFFTTAISTFYDWVRYTSCFKGRIFIIGDGTDSYAPERSSSLIGTMFIVLDLEALLCIFVSAKILWVLSWSCGLLSTSEILSDIF